MTIEDRYLIDLKDLAIVRMECKACGAAVSQNVKDWERARTQCAGCGAEWMIGESPEHDALKRLGLALRGLIAGEHEARYRVRFEINRPK